MSELSVTLYPQGDGWTHVLLRGLVLGAKRDPLPGLLTGLTEKHELNPSFTRWYECWLQDGWGQLLPAWQGAKCIRVDWKPMASESAMHVVRGSYTEKGSDTKAEAA